MRKAIIAIMALGMMACSQTDEQKAERLITDYLERNANDPSSVEIIEISPIKTDSVKSIEDDVEYTMLLNEATDEYNLSTDFFEMGVKDEAEEHKQKGMEADAKRKKLEEDFKPYSRGRLVILQYRAKNAMGALVKSTAIVRFNDELTEIKGFSE